MQSVRTSPVVQPAQSVIFTQKIHQRYIKLDFALERQKGHHC